MSHDEELSRLWFKRIVGFLTYLFVGAVLLDWRLGPGLRQGVFEADLLSILLSVIWVAFFPLVSLFGLAIDTVVTLINPDDEDVKLR